MKRLLPNIACLFALTGILAGAEKPNIVLIMADDIGYECYEAYGDYETHMALVEELVAGLATELHGSTTVTYDGREIELTWEEAFAAGEERRVFRR